MTKSPGASAPAVSIDDNPYPKPGGESRIAANSKPGGGSRIAANSKPGGVGLRSAANSKMGGRYATSRLQKVRPRGSLKAAVAKLVASVGVERARELTGRGATQLYRYGDPDEAAQMPVDLVAALMRDGGATAVADYLAAEAGCVLLPVTPLAGPAELAAHVGAVGRHVGTAFQDYAEALADGEIDAGERARLIADLDDILQAAAAARADLMDHGEDGT